MKALALLLAGALWCGSVYAQVPRQINYQGYLTNPGGTPVNATVSMVFGLYAAPSGAAAALHSETQNVVVTNGVFNVLIGAQPGQPLALAFDVPYWLGVKVAADAEMTPRQAVAAAGYAIRAASAEALAVEAVVPGSQVADGSVSAAKLASNGCINGQVLKYDGAAWACAADTDTNSGGTVTSITAGAGLTGGTITTTGTIGLGTVPVANGGTGQTTLTNNGIVYGKGASSVGVTVAGAAGQLLAGTAGAPAWTGSPTLSGNLSVGGSVGVGVTPASRFHVNGTSWFQGDTTPLPAGAGKGIAIGYADSISTGYIYGFNYGNFTPTNLALNGPGGNVGIGTLTPVAKLEVVGQDALRLVGYQPFLTLLDDSAGYARSRIQGAGGNMHFYPESFIGGPPAVTMYSGSGNVSVSGNLSVNSGIQVIGGGVVVNSGSLSLYDGALNVWGSVFFNLAGIGGDQDLCRNSSNRGIVQCSSSLRYKEDARTYDGGLDVVSRLRPISFTWKQSGLRDIGFGAEEVEQIEPLLTTRNQQDEVEGVKYKQITAVLVNAVNEQQHIIEDQQAQIHELKKLVCLANREAEFCRK